MPTITAVQEQIFAKEGFRVSFERLDAAARDIPAYDFPVMAPNTWKVSDWKMQRLGNYLMLFRAVTVYRGDGDPIKSDMRLGHLRDSYFAAQYGSLDPEAPSTVVPIAAGERGAAAARKKKR